jgi:Divergent InlB B-repeat domain
MLYRKTPHPSPPLQRGLSWRFGIAALGLILSALSTGVSAAGCEMHGTPPGYTYYTCNGLGHHMTEGACIDACGSSSSSGSSTSTPSYAVIKKVSPDNSGKIDEKAAVTTSGQTAKVELTAVPNSGWKFVRWENSFAPECSGTDATVTVSLNAIKTCTAFFEIVPTPGFGSSIGQGSTLNMNPTPTVSTSFNISETGNATLVIQSATITGEYASLFKIASPSFPLSIPDGASPQPITIQCTPSTGLRTATLELTTNDVAHPKTTYTLSCQASGASVDTTPAVAAKYSGSPIANTLINLGQTTVGGALTTTIHVSEIGNAALQVSLRGLFSNTPNDFAVLSQLPLNIADGGAAQTIQVQCKPSEVGTRVAVLQLATNDPYQEIVSYTLECKGVSSATDITIINYSLTLSTNGHGVIDKCGTQCIQKHPKNMVLTLVPVAAPESQFVRWTGDCSSDGKVEMTADKVCSAYFELEQVVSPPTTSETSTSDGIPKTPLNLGYVDEVTVNTGQTASNLTIGSKGSVSGGTLACTTMNQGIVSNLTIATHATLRGGRLSGFNTNKGVIEDATNSQYAEISGGSYRGKIVNRGKLIDAVLLPNTEVDNQNGILHNPVILPGAFVNGGQLTGIIILLGTQNSQFDEAQTQVITRVADIPAAVFSQFNDEILATLSEEQLAQITLEQRAQIPTSQPVNSAACDITKQEQTIDFSMLLDKSIGAENVTLQAKSSSGLEVDFSLDKTSLGCSLVNDNQVKILAEGVCVINAYQNGSLQFNPAPVQTQRFKIVDSSSKKDQDITVTVTNTNQKALFVLQVTDELGNSITQAHSQVFSSHSENTDPAMPMSIAQPDKGKVNLRFTVKAAPNDVGKNAGLKIRARIENKWMTLTTLNGWQEVESAYETIKLPSYEMDYSLFSGALLPGTYPIELSYTTDAGDTAKANFEFTMIESVQRIEPIAQTIHWELSAGGGVVGEKLNVTVTGGESGEPVKIVGIVGRTAELTATASSGLTVSFSSSPIDICTVSGNTVSFVSAGICTITANQVGNEQFNPVKQSVDIDVASKGVSSLNFTDEKDNPIFQTVEGDTLKISLIYTASAADVEKPAKFYVQATSGDQSWMLTDKGVVAVTTPLQAFTSKTLSATNDPLHLYTGTLLAGEYSVYVAYETANGKEEVTSVFTVKGKQTVTFTNLPTSPKVGEKASLTLTGGNSNNPIVLTSKTTDVCTVQDKTVTFVAEGNCVIGANQAGNEIFVDGHATGNIAVKSLGVFSLSVTDKDGKVITQVIDADTLKIGLTVKAPTDDVGKTAKFYLTATAGTTKLMFTNGKWVTATNPLKVEASRVLPKDATTLSLYSGTLGAGNYVVSAKYQIGDKTVEATSVLNVVSKVYADAYGAIKFFGGTDRKAEVYAQQTEAGKSIAYALAYATAIDSGKSTTYAAAYALQIEAKKSDAYAKTYATQIAGGKSVAFATAYATQIADRRSDAYATAYATQIAAGKSDAYAAVYAQQIAAGKSVAYATQIAAGKSVAYAEQIAAGKSDAYATAYAQAREAEKSDRYATAYATQIAAGKSDAYATQIAAGKSDAYAAVYAQQIAAGKSDAYATQIAAGKSDAYATVYAEKIAGGSSAIFATAYAEKIMAGKSDAYADAYATRILFGESDSYATAYVEQRNAGKSAFYATAYAEKINAGKSDRYATAYAQAREDGKSEADAAFLAKARL